MKTVFDSDEIAHVWAHQRAPRGRSASAMSFSGPVLFSYSTWIAERLAPGIYVLNDTSYSVSTSRHQHRAHMAIPGGLVFRVTGIPTGSQGYAELTLKDTGRKLFKFYVSEAARLQQEAEKARQPKKDRLLGLASGMMNEARRVSDVFMLRLKVDDKTVARLDAAKARDERNRAKALAERRKREEEQAKARLVEWLNGEGDAWLDTNGPTYLRLDPDDAFTVQTSRGIRLPIKTAKLALRFIRSKRESGWRRNGETFVVRDMTGADWDLDSVSAEGAVAGCHRFSWEELDRFGAILDRHEDVVLAE